MHTLQGLQRKIRSAHDLLSVVKTMKSLAAVNIRQFEEAAEALEEYHRVVEVGWQIFAISQRRIPRLKASQQAVVLVIGTDQGMCGQFNESIVELARTHGDEVAGKGITPHYWTAGERARAGLEETENVSMHFHLPSSIAGINERMHDIVLAFADHQERLGLDTLYILYNMMISGGSYQPARMRVLPLDQEWLNKHRRPWPARCLPMTGQESGVLFRHLFKQHLFASFYRAFAQSMASENAARLASMYAAEKNIEEMEEKLQATFRQTRQNTITEELFDIISGFEALS